MTMKHLVVVDEDELTATQLSNCRRVARGRRRRFRHTLGQMLLLLLRPVCRRF